MLRLCEGQVLRGLQGVMRGHEESAGLLNKNLAVQCDMAPGAVWHGVRCSVTWCQVQCGMAPGAVWHGVRCSVAWCQVQCGMAPGAVWHGARCSVTSELSTPPKPERETAEEENKNIYIHSSSSTTCTH